MALRRPSHANRTTEQNAKIWHLVEELRVSQAAAVAALNRTIDLQAELSRLQGASQEDINVLFDRKPRNVYFVDLLTRITNSDRIKKWAGLRVR